MKDEYLFINQSDIKFIEDEYLEQSNKVARIKWACRRGMLELDFIFNEFLANGFLVLTEIEQDEFLLFLENNDPDLYSWLMGFRYPENPVDITMVNRIRAGQQTSSGN